MKKALSQSLFIVALLALVSIFSVRNAYPSISGGSPSPMALIGTFMPMDEKGDPRTFELLIKEKRWRFKVSKAYHLGSSTTNPWRLLDEIIPRRLKVFGNEKVMQPLMQPDIAGKIFELKGRIYLRKNTFFLSSAEEVSQEGEQAESE